MNNDGENALQIRNLGPSAVSSVSLEVYWPEKLLDGSDMLYITTVPRIIKGEGTCTMTIVNPYNITVSSALRGNFPDPEAKAALKPKPSPFSDSTENSLLYRETKTFVSDFA